MICVDLITGETKEVVLITGDIDISRLNPRYCKFAKPYMVDNGVLDVYSCQRFSGTCYFEPNGGRPIKKMCGTEEAILLIKSNSSHAGFARNSIPA